MFAFGSALASSASGCYEHHVLGAGAEPRDSGGFRADSGGGGSLYGAPPDASLLPRDAGPRDAGEDVLGGPAYGGPFPFDAGPEEDSGAVAGMYGAPFLIDAGAEEDGGGPANLYGGPPSDRGGSSR